MKRGLETPQFLKDIYGDLRDRRLLLPVVGLIVTVVAVPFLLGGDPAPVPSAPATANVPSDATEVRSAVLVEQTGIRNYRKRLEALREKNPFKQQFEIESPDTSVPVGEAGSSEAGDPSISLSGSESPRLPSRSRRPAPTPRTLPRSEGILRSPSVSFGGSPDSTTPSEQPTEVREVETVISYEVGVEVGRAGELEARDSVERFEPLPSEQAPVVIYVGVSENGKRAGSSSLATSPRRRVTASAPARRPGSARS